jgi:hypothetical protein
MNNKEFDNILNECLERLLVEGESLEQCLARYPEQAAELKPLLETALAAREASAIQPRPDFRARARYEFNSALKETAAVRSRTSWGWFPRWATVAAVVLVLVLAGGGTFAAADSSMPDSPLYSVKLATEQVRLTLTPSQMGKAGLYAQLADRRVAEIAYMANKGDTRQVELITQRLDRHLALLTVAVLAQRGGQAPALMAPPEEAGAPPETTPPATYEPPPSTTEALPGPELAPQPGKDWGGSGDSARNVNQAQLRDTLLSDAARNQSVLQQALDEGPESTREALRRALAVSEDGYEEALEALE